LKVAGQQHQKVSVKTLIGLIAVSVFFANCGLPRPPGRTRDRGAPEDERRVKAELSFEDLPSTSAGFSELSAAPELGDGVVCFVASDGTLRAVDAKTGRILWTLKPDDSIVTTVVVSGGTAYASSHSTVYSVDLKSGHVRWLKTGLSHSSSPAVAYGLVLFFDEDVTLYALDPGTGRERWRVDLEEEQPEVIENGAIYCLGSETVRCLDAATGSEIWRYTFGSELSTDISTGDGVACVADETGRVWGLDERNGKLIWQVSVGSAPSSVKESNGIAYFRTDDLLYAIELRRGREVWRYYDETWDDYGLTEVDSGIAFVEDKGNVSGIDVSTGKRRLQFHGYGYLGMTGSLVLLDRGAHIEAVDARTGRRAWRFEMPERYGNLSKVSASDGVAFFVAGEEDLFGISLNSGKRIWSLSPSDRAQPTSPSGR
jgi:outer membrane protein assembly factor BamB